MKRYNNTRLNTALKSIASKPEQPGCLAAIIQNGTDSPKLQEAPAPRQRVSSPLAQDVAAFTSLSY